MAEKPKFETSWANGPFPCDNCHKNPMPDGFTYWCKECVEEARAKGLFDFMELRDYDDEPDGAWWAILEDSVKFFNQDNGTHYDPFDAVHMYIQFGEEGSDADAK